MCLDINKLSVIDDLPELGEHTLEQEITILAPYLLDKVLRTFEANDDGEKDTSSTLRKSKHREAG